MSPKTPLPEQLLRRSRELRRKATVPEPMLWNALKRKQVQGLRFRFQHPVQPYIVDFYCHAAALVVELDGLSHVGQVDADQQRQRFLEDQGYRVMRFTNDQVLENLSAVVDMISLAVGELLSAHESSRAAGNQVNPPRRVAEPE